MHRSKRNGIVVGFGLLGCCAGAQALGLGDVHSPVFMGQRLSVGVPLRLKLGEQVDEGCLAAEVRLGEDRLPDSLVSVHLETRSAGKARVRVSTAVPVSEPWATVQVSAGCASPVKRQYVLMVDPPQRGPKKTAELGNVGAKPPRPVRLPADEVSRLLLDPMAADALVEPHLRLDTALHPPADTGLPVNEQARRSWAHAYWWALQAAPQDVNQMQARLQDLEREVADLLAPRAPAAPEQADAADAEASAPARQVLSSKLLPVDPAEVAHVRLVGLLGVAGLGLAALGYRRWLSRPVDWADVPKAASWLPPWPGATDSR